VIRFPSPAVEEIMIELDDSRTEIELIGSEWTFSKIFIFSRFERSESKRHKIMVPDISLVAIKSPENYFVNIFFWKFSFFVENFRFSWKISLFFKIFVFFQNFRFFMKIFLFFFENFRLFLKIFVFFENVRFFSNFPFLSKLSLFFKFSFV